MSLHHRFSSQKSILYLSFRLGVLRLRAALGWCSLFPLTLFLLLVGPVHADDARAKAIADTRAEIEQTLAARGGTWESWAGQLAEYRADLKAHKKAKLTKDGMGFSWEGYRMHAVDDITSRPEGQNPFLALLHLDRELKKLGIDLIVAIIPAKLSIYPDFALKAEDEAVRAPEDRMVALATQHMLYRLLTNNVEVVNLHTVFRDYRKEHGDKRLLYYGNTDTHWLNLGAQVAAQRIAERLRRYPEIAKAMAAENPFRTYAHTNKGSKADKVRIIQKSEGGKIQKYSSANDAPVLIVGDSNHNYNWGLGGHFAAQLAYQLHMPVAEVIASGLSSLAPVRIARDKLLKQRKVIVVSFNEKNFARQDKNWPLVNLDTELKEEASKLAPPPTRCSGIVQQVSSRPDPKGDYPHFLMKIYLTALKDPSGKDVGSGDGVIHVLAMHNRKLLPIARVKEGDKLQFGLKAWNAVSDRYGRIETGSLDDVELELNKNFYWAEFDGQPTLSADNDLNPAAEEN